MRVVEDETCAFSCRSSKKSVVDRVGFEGWSFLENKYIKANFSTLGISMIFTVTISRFNILFIMINTTENLSFSFP